MVHELWSLKFWSCVGGFELICCYVLKVLV
jgi:hypothetical protein